MQFIFKLTEYWVLTKSLVNKHWQSIINMRPPKTFIGWAYVAIITIAIITRLWDLSGRSLHYDEILHAWYSWMYSEGLGYSHTPLTHGPFLFHGGATSFFVFGSTDFTARLLPALFGILLVGMPYLLRREIGKFGAISVSIYLLISPTFLYFSRFMRNDIYMAVWALALITIMIKYQKNPRLSLLFAWAIIWALAYSTKESAFLLAGTIGLILISQSSKALWQWLRGNRFLSDIGPSGDLLIVLGTCSLPLWAPLTGIVQGLLGIVLVNPDPNDPRVIAGQVIRSNAETGAPVGGSLYIATFVFVAFLILSIVIGLLWSKKRWPLLAGTFTAIWLVFFTSFFTNWQGLFTGTWGSLGYWMAQQAVERASQPWYYYFLGLLTYESLATVLAGIGTIYLLVRHRTKFNITIITWATMTVVLFTIAGEKMPWLLVGTTLPLTIICGIVIDKLLNSALHLNIRLKIYLIGLLLFIAIPPIFFYLILPSKPFPIWGFYLAISIGLVSIISIIVFIYRLKNATGNWQSTRAILPMLAVSLICVWSLGISASSIRANYSYGSMENPNELFVYSQTGQETSYIAQCMNQIKSRYGNGIKILIDESDNFAWQWRWYLRDFENVDYKPLNQQPLKGATPYEVIMMSKASENIHSDTLKNYVKTGGLHHLWWFPNYAYEDLSLTTILNGALSPQGWQTLYNYQVHREMNSKMQRSDGVIYLTTQLNDYVPSCTKRQ